MIKAPFRWAGSKAKLLATMFDKFKHTDVYVEPFLGSGVVLFNILKENKYQRYYVNDINVSIIEFYKAIQQYPEHVIKALRAQSILYEFVPNKKAMYLDARKKFNTDKSNWVLFWFLMKTGFNGLYRENKKGEYNVPFGDKDKIVFGDKQIAEIRTIHKLIKDVDFQCMDYKKFYKYVEKKEKLRKLFSYNDPPYINSQKYTAERFDNEELSHFLSDKNFFVAISEVESDEADKVYSLFNKIHCKKVDRCINPENRQSKIEVLFTNY